MAELMFKIVAYFDACGTNSRIGLKLPFTLTSKLRKKSSDEESAIVACLGRYPAFATGISMGPILLYSLAKGFFSDSASVISAVHVETLEFGFSFRFLLLSSTMLILFSLTERSPMH